MYRVHDPTITIAIGSVWLQLSSERVSLGAWKIARQTPWFLMMVIYRYLGRKNYTCNLRMKVINLKREKCFFVMLLSYISMSYKNKTDDSWVCRTMRKYKWNRQTDRHTANSMSFKSKPTDWDTCISKHVILSTKKGIGMYKCTRKLQLHQNIFKPCPQLACCKIIKE